MGTAMRNLVLLVALAIYVKAESAPELTKTLELSNEEAKSFLHSRRKRSAYEECREGCWWEELEEINSNHEWIREYMRWWNCVYRTRCSSGYYCQTTGSDYRRNTYLSQACYRHGGWCAYGSWGSWGACSTSCNPGTQTRYASRSCSCPTRVGGGNYCSGSSTTSQTQSCQVARCSCGSLSAPTNGQKTGSSYLYQDVVSFTCNSGHYLSSGSSSRTCQVNRAWSGSSPTCSRVSCGAPTAVSNSARSGSSYLYGDKVTYTCNTGYELTSGNLQRTCQANTQWSGSSPVCSRVSCGDPGQGVAASRTSGGTRYGDSIAYSCNTGYERNSGDFKITCQSNKLWNGTQLSCKRVTCPDPGFVQNSTRALVGTLYTDSVTYSCHTGYEPNSGSSTRTCTASRTWSGSTFSCKRITCPTLTSHNNATQTGSTFRYLDHVSWTCNTGYERLSGDPHLHCQANRAWNGTQLSCTRITCPTLTSHNNATQTGSSFRYLDHVTWTCNTGYERDAGDFHVQCLSNRQWNGTVLSCKRIICPSLSAHSNATQTGSGFRYLDNVSWQCHSGYERDTGDSTVQCQSNRAWNGTALTCKRITCPTLTSHNNATQTGSTFRYLDHVSWTCNTGYERLSGDPHLQCQANRAWNGTQLSCTRVTCPTLASHNNATQTGSSFRYLDHVTWTCNTGYERDAGDFHVQCLSNRQWNGTVLSCKRITCPSLLAHNNATQTGSGFRYLDNVSWQCHSGYERDTGDSNVQCQSNRAWNGTALTCKRITCPSLISHNNATQTGSTFRYLDHVSWTCNTGYERLSGDPHLQCQANRTWNGTQLSCTRITCPTLTSHNNATQTGSSFRYLDHVTWTCNTGYERDAGDFHVQCLSSRQWNGTVLSCKRITCPSLSAHNNATQTGNAFRYLDNVSWQCHSGYERDTGDSNVQCQSNRAWNGTALTCKRITCPTLAPNNNSTQTGAAYRYLDFVSWQCDIGYERDVGDYLVQCQANQQWNGTVLQCKRKICPSPIPAAIASYSHVHNSSKLVASAIWQYQDEVELRCDPGYKRSSGDRIRTCMATSTWNGTDFSCTDINECASSPCLNGGQCNNLVNHYTCTCLNGFTGANCQIVPTGTAASAALAALGTQTMQSVSNAIAAGGTSALFASASFLEPGVIMFVVSILAAIQIQM